MIGERKFETGGGRKSTGRKNKQKVESVRIGQKRRAIGRKEMEREI